MNTTHTSDGLQRFWARKVVGREQLNPQVAGWPFERIVSALGYPGYGRGFSGRVLERMARTGANAAAAIEQQYYADKGK